MEKLDEYIEMKNKIDSVAGVKLGFVVGGFGKMDSLVRPEEHDGTLSNGAEEKQHKVKNVQHVAIDNALLKLVGTCNKSYATIEFRKKDKHDLCVSFDAEHVCPIHKITSELVKPLCSDAPFGDLKSGETKVDHAVRKAWTFPGARFLIDGKDVAQTYVKDGVSAFFGDDVELIPHAFNMYEVGGHFASHVDTQRHDRMVGTLVIVFSPAMEGGDMEVGDDLVEFGEKNVLSAVVFGATTTHRVHEVQGGVRYSVSYDVCLAKKRSSVDGHAKELEIIKCAMERVSIPTIGVILQHRYSPKQLAEGCFVGTFDRAVAEADVPFERRLVPVLWRVSLNHARSEWSHDETLKNVVYTLDTRESESKIPFFCAFPQKVKLLEGNEDGAEFTGNESHDGKSDRIYASYAVLLSLPAPGKKVKINS